MSAGPLKQVEVVAAVIRDGGQILCVQRAPHAREYISQKWEFPGGKIEAGETPPEALVREIREELGVAVEVGPLVTTVRHAYPHFELTMHAFDCQLLSPRTELTLSEHIDSMWLTADDAAFATLDWAAADVPIVHMLRKTARGAS